MEEKGEVGHPQKTIKIYILLLKYYHTLHCHLFVIVIYHNCLHTLHCHFIIIFCTVIYSSYYQLSQYKIN